jgi:tubulin--tyrosine ligase
MRNYYTYCCDNEDVFNTLPLTFHIKDGISDPYFDKFKKYYEIEKLECQKEKSRKNIWIVKPGENSNRGTGIKVE